MYSKGQGVARNPATAYYWLTLATTGEAKTARRYLSNLEDFLTSEQISKAKEKAKSFRPSDPPATTGRAFEPFRSVPGGFRRNRFDPAPDPDMCRIVIATFVPGHVERDGLALEW